MASYCSAQHDLLKELGFSDDTVEDASNSEGDNSDGEIVLDTGDEIQVTELKKLLKQTQLELRTAQKNLMEAEYGKEKKLRILRRTHQSALSLKNSLIQELQDIISGKDEYICQLENRLIGKKVDIITEKDTALSKLVDRFTELSKEYVELQSNFERVKEELSKERENLTYNLHVTKSTTPLLSEIKELHLKLEILHQERQSYLHLKDENITLLKKVEELKKMNSISKASQQKNDTKTELQSTSSENETEISTLCEWNKIFEEKNKNICVPSFSKESITEKESDIWLSFEPKILNVYRSIQEIMNFKTSVLNEFKNLYRTFTEEFLSISHKICIISTTLAKRSIIMRQKYLSEMKQRKHLHNQLVEHKGNIRVFCRIRPKIAEDGIGDDATTVVTIDNDDDSLLLVDSRDTLKKFEVDKVFGPNSSQQQIFEEVLPLITSCLDGFNVCIIAYGQTGSGKTYTMEGSNDEPGINQRALFELFTTINTSKSEWKYSVLVSMLEVYNDSTFDLLSGNNKLNIKTNSDGLYIPGLTQVSVSDLDEVNTVFSLGHQSRSTAATKMNICSSRSHAILSVSVMGKNLISGTKTIGKLNLVDLAGSERVHKSGSEGIRLEEAKHINKSLCSLADVIYNLRIKSQHIPYRNSKLTYLLRDSLGGNSKTLMVVQVSPVKKNSNESVCSLNFAQRVRGVELTK